MDKSTPTIASGLCRQEPAQARFVDWPMVASLGSAHQRNLPGIDRRGAADRVSQRDDGRAQVILDPALRLSTQPGAASMIGSGKMPHANQKKIDRGTG